MAAHNDTTHRGARGRQKAATRINDRFWSDNNVERDLGMIEGDVIIVGDIHGCWYTLCDLVTRIGGGPDGKIPDGVTLVSVGDIHDKGGHNTRVLRWAIENCASGRLVVVDSNHGRALVRRLTRGSNVAKPSVEKTYQEILSEPDAETFRKQVRHFLATRPVYARLGTHQGDIVVAHAAAAPRLMGVKRLRPSEVRYHMLSREFNWTGDAVCVVGHVRTPEPTVETGPGKGTVLRIDTGCAEPNGRLTAWHANENRFITVPVDTRDLTGEPVEELVDDEFDDHDDPIVAIEALA